MDIQEFARKIPEKGDKVIVKSVSTVHNDDHGAEAIVTEVIDHHPLPRHHIQVEIESETSDMPHILILSNNEYESIEELDIEKDET